MLSNSNMAFVARVSFLPRPPNIKLPFVFFLKYFMQLCSVLLFSTFVPQMTIFTGFLLN